MNSTLTVELSIDRSNVKDPGSSSFVIETNGLSKSYKNVQALKNLDLKVPKNSVFAFLGPNGAGKTTTIKLLLGLIQPTTGSGTVFGQDIKKDNVSIRSKIGYLPQGAKFHEYMTAREVLSYTLKFYVEGEDEELSRRVSELLDLVDLSNKADRPVEQFSGGERQRLGIAQAMINSPELLILDEPAASLDPIGRRDVLQIIEKLKGRTTVIFCTHILADVQKISDQVTIMNKGELIAQGPIEEIMQKNQRASFVVQLRTKETDFDTIESLPWVDGINVNKKKYTELEIHVNDLETAEEQLLYEILNGVEGTVIEYRRKSDNLEDVFLEIIGEKNGN